MHVKSYTSDRIARFRTETRARKTCAHLHQSLSHSSGKHRLRPVIRISPNELYSSDMAALSRLRLFQRHLPALLSSNQETSFVRLCTSCYTRSGESWSESLIPDTQYGPPNSQGRNTRASQRSHSVSSTAIFDDVVTRNRYTRELRRPKKSMKISLQQFNDENRYMHNHVRSKLVDLSHLGAMIDTLAIKSPIDELSRFNELDYPSVQAFSVARSDHFRNLKSFIRQMDYRELAILMTYIKDSEKPEVRVVKKMIDVQLQSRLKNTKRKFSASEVDLFLYLADVFFQSHAITTFVTELVHRFASNDMSLNDKQLLYMLFLVVLERDHQGLLTRYEDRISKLLDEPTLEDISLVCMSYFKTMSIIENPTIQNKILDGTLKLLPSIDFSQPGYCAIIKSIRYSRDQSMREGVMKIIAKVTRHPSCIRALDSIFNLTQTAKLMETYRIYDHEMLDRLEKSVFRKVDEFRIKDIQFVLTTLSNSRWKDLVLDDSLRQNFDTLCQTIVTEGRPDARYQHTHLFPIIRSFIMFGYYNDDLINYVNRLLEDEEMVVIMRESVLDFEKTLLLTHAATRIESDGVRLEGSPALLLETSKSIRRAGSTGSVRKDSSIGHLSFLLNPSVSDKKFEFTAKMRSIAKSLASMEGLDTPRFHHSFQFTMAYQNYADLVISVNQPAPGSFDPTSLMPRRIAPNEKHCLVFAVQHSDFMDGCDRLSGFKEFIMRLLIRLGYHVVVVNLDKPELVQLSRQIMTILQDQDIKLPSDAPADSKRASS